MFKFALRRLAVAVPLLFFVGTLTFFLGQLSVIDPTEAIAGANPTEDQLEALRERLGLDDPPLKQYWTWLSGIVQGDLGESLYGGSDVATRIKFALPTTLSLAFGGLFVSIFIGVPAGIVAGLRPGSVTDRITTMGATVGQAAPNFWLGLILIFVFALQFGWFPAVGYTPLTESVSGWARSLVLPSLALGFSAAASLARQTRSAVIGVFQQEYVRTAIAKGLPKRKVIFKHALKNAASPVLTVLSFQVSYLLGGSIVVEQLFAMNGLGSLAIGAVLGRDQNIIQGIVLISVAVVVLVNLVVDLLYGFVNPKVRTR